MLNSHCPASLSLLDIVNNKHPTSLRLRDEAFPQGRRGRRREGREKERKNEAKGQCKTIVKGTEPVFTKRTQCSVKKLSLVNASKIRTVSMCKCCHRLLWLHNPSGLVASGLRSCESGAIFFGRKFARCSNRTIRIVDINHVFLNRCNSNNWVSNQGTEKRKCPSTI